MFQWLSLHRLKTVILRGVLSYKVTINLLDRYDKNHFSIQTLICLRPSHYIRVYSVCEKNSRQTWADNNATLGECSRLDSDCLEKISTKLLH